VDPAVSCRPGIQRISDSLKGNLHLFENCEVLKEEKLRRRQDGGPDAGTSLPPLQPMERPAEDALERGGESNGMESGQMPTRASL